jgi:hypothetical protein
MGLFSRKAATAATEKSTADTPESHSPASQTPAMSANHSTTSLAEQSAPVHPSEESKVTLLALALGAVSSMGGFMFGYESGQISGMHPQRHTMEMKLTTI